MKSGKVGDGGFGEAGLDAVGEADGEDDGLLEAV